MAGIDLDRLGTALRILRMQIGLEGRHLAEKAGITPSMLSGYESGRQLPSLLTLAKILEALDADLLALERALKAGRRSRSGKLALEEIQAQLGADEAALLERLLGKLR